MENTSYGRAALSKLAPVAENFRIYEAGWLGDKPSEWTVMEVKGMEFRAAKTGPNKGKLTVPVPGTKRTVYVTEDEMRAFEVPPNDQAQPTAKCAAFCRSAEANCWVALLFPWDDRYEQ